VPDLVQVQVVLPGIGMMPFYWETECVQTPHGQMIRFECNLPNVSLSNIVTPDAAENFANGLLERVREARTGIVVAQPTDIRDIRKEKPGER
jgi:hypothetical protein